MSFEHDVYRCITTGYVRLVGQEPAPSKCVLLSTSRVVRRDMRDWVLSQEGDRWSVKFDVRDLGGHLDSTFRGWSATLAARVRLVLARLLLVFALPLDFHGRVRVVRSMFLPAALHGIEASLFASDSLLKLRSSICRVVWSRRQPLAGVGAVLSLLDGPAGCDPCFAQFGFGFACFGVILPFGLVRLVEFIAFWIWLVRVALVMVLFTFSLLVLLRLVSDGIPLLWLGLGLVYPCSEIWLALFSIFALLFLMPGKIRLLLSFVVVKVFGVAHCWMFGALCNFLTLLMFETEIRVCFGVFCLGVWNGFLLSRGQGAACSMSLLWFS